MAYEIRGSLWGTLCHDVREPLAGLELRAYRSRGDRVTEQAVAADKETFHEVAEGERTGAPLAVARVDESGAYVLTIDDKEYDGGPLDLDLYVEKPPRPRQDPTAKPRQFAVTTLQPRWRQTEEGRHRSLGVRDPEPVLVPHPGALRHLDDQRPDHDVRRQDPDPGGRGHRVRRRLAAGRPARDGDDRRDRPLRPDVPRVRLPAHAVLAVHQRRADRGSGRLRQGGARWAADHHRDAGGRSQAWPAERRALLLPGPVHGQGGRRPRDRAALAAGRGVRHPPRATVSRARRSTRSATPTRRAARSCSAAR